jgi:glycerate 2-kinase
MSDQVLTNSRDDPAPQRARVRDRSASALVAPATFKGTFSAAEVAAAIARGVREGGFEAEELPIADGGDDTLDVLVSALGGELRTAAVTDPLGRPVEASFGLLPSGRAVVEMARASGLTLLADDERDAWLASTRGTGELIVAAVEAEAQSVIVTVGGSATTDGGAGCLEALDAAAVDPQLEVVCDVRTAWEDAPRVYGPQKGADAATVKRLEARLDELAQRAPVDPRGVPMTGAAGGLSGGLFAFRGAKLMPGAAYVLDLIGFDRRARAASLVVTGEGRLDEQTPAGKAVAEAAARCRQASVACHAVVGRNDLEPHAAQWLGLAAVHEATTLPELTEAGYRIAKRR